MLQQRLTESDLLLELKQIEAAQKNPERFGVLYEKYYRQIFRFVYKRTEDEDICADITSQVFLKAMLSLPKYSYKGVPFSAWLYRIASNEVNQHFRSQKHDDGQRVVSIEKKGIIRMLTASGEGENPGQQHTELEEFQAALLAVMEDMEPDDLQLIELRFFEDIPYKEVAFIMGITETNAKVRVHRILERLRKRLEKKMGRSYEA